MTSGGEVLSLCLRLFPSIDSISLLHYVVKRIFYI